MHDVDATPDEVPDGLDVVALEVVDHLCSQPAAEGRLLCATHDGDNAGPLGHAQLHDRRAQTACCPQDHHRLPGGDTTAADGRVVRRMRRNEVAGGLFVRHRIRHLEDHRNAHGHRSQASPGLDGARHHALAQKMTPGGDGVLHNADTLLAGYVGADHRNRVGATTHRDVGQGQGGHVHPHDHPIVERVESRAAGDPAAQAHTHAVQVRWCRLRDLVEHEAVLRLTEVVHSPRLHDPPFRRPTAAFARSSSAHHGTSGGGRATPPDGPASRDRHC